VPILLGWFLAVVATRLLSEVELSTRRIPQGPGRRPKSLARRRFMELLNKGVSIRAACREIGVCRQTGQNWKNGVTVIRKDGSVKHVPPLHPLSTRLISPRFLSEAERVHIADLFSQGIGPGMAACVARGLFFLTLTISGGATSTHQCSVQMKDTEFFKAPMPFGSETQKCSQSERTQS